MSAATVSVQQATIPQYAKRPQLAMIAGQFVPVAEQAIKEKQSPLSYLEVSLGMEVEEPERNTVARRIKDAHFPNVKTLEEFAFSDAPHLPPRFKESQCHACLVVDPDDVTHGHHCNRWH